MQKLLAQTLYKLPSISSCVKFIQKDINRRLLILVLVLLVLYSATTIYYETRLSKIMNQYKSEQQIFGGLSPNAVLQELNNTSDLRENVQKYKEYLGKKYDDLNTVNNNLKKEIESLQAEMRLIKSQIEYQKAKDLGPTEQFRLFQSKTEEIVKLKETIKKLCSDIKSYNITDLQCTQANWD